jgi:hypothetical protein
MGKLALVVASAFALGMTVPAEAASKSGKSSGSVAERCQKLAKERAGGSRRRQQDLMVRCIDNGGRL